MHGREVSDMADQKEQLKENIDVLGKSPMGACAPTPMVSCSETCLSDSFCCSTLFWLYV